MKPQDSLSAEERVLAEQLARLGPHGEPSPALDARILAAAHAEVSRPSTARKPRWPVAMGLAASALLAVGVAWQLRPVDEAPLISGPPPVEQTAAATVMTESADEPTAAAELADTDAALARQEAQASVEAPSPVRALQEPVQAPAPAPPAQAVSKARPRPEPQARSAIRPTPPAEAKSSPAPVVARRQSAPAPAAIADQVDSETVALPLPPPAPASASAPASQARAVSASKPASDAEVSSARAETDSYRIRNSAADASAARTQAYEQRAVAGEGQTLDRVAVTGTRLQRTDLQVPVHDDARLATDEWLERIRLRRDLGDGASAAASLRLYVQEHPFRKVPEDLRPLLAE
jgi:hypothetical protein